MSSGPPESRGETGKKAGCLVAIGASGVVFLAFFAIVVSLALRMWSRFDAPGREALLKIGCDEAQIADLRSLAADAPLSDKPIQAVVVCQMRPGRQGPPCEAIAAAYGAGKESPERSLVVQAILGDRSEQAACKGVYDRKGAYLGPPPEGMGQ